MRGYGRILTILVAAVLLIGGGIVAVGLFYPRLPHPAEANRDELLRWLVVRDLRTESPEIRSVLARRLEEEFRTGLDWEATAEHLDESQRERIWDNVVVLMKPWFFDKLERYFQLAAAERPAYLNELLDTMAVWKGVDSIRPQQASSAHFKPPGSLPSNLHRQEPTLLRTLYKQVEEWKKEAKPADRERIGEFFSAVQAQWFLRKVAELSSSPG